MKQERTSKEKEVPKSRSEDEGKHPKVKKEPASPSKHDKGRDSETEKSER